MGSFLGSVLGRGVVQLLQPLVRTPARLATTAGNAVAGAIEVAGGRKFFYVFWFLPLYVIVTQLLGIDAELVRLSLYVMAGCVGAEGLADIKGRSASQ